MAQLFGRSTEQRRLERVLDDVRSSAGEALVLRGEAGMGKTALLHYAEGKATDFAVLRATGVESEMDLHLAGVQQLCAPLIDQLDDLPPPQHEALAVAFGLKNGAAAMQFLVALAVLTLLADAADEQPVLCVVDDVQWIDMASRQVLGFLARRLQADRIAMLFAVADTDPAPDLHGLETISLRPLTRSAARQMLRRTVPGPVDPAVVDQAITEAAGNPLALVELPYGLTPAQLAGGFGLPTTQPLNDRIEERYRHRLEGLPTPTRTLLLIAAADPTGDSSLLWRAAAELGIGPDAAAPAERARLFSVDGGVRFYHPLIRSTVYREATAVERAAAHRALADATDGARDPDRRAWHRARATIGQDDELATELEEVAGRAQSRGGFAAAAVFLERSADLSTDGERRAERGLRAARAKLAAGSLDGAEECLRRIDASALDAGHRLRLELASAQVDHGRSFSPEVQLRLLDIARRLSDSSPSLARETYLEALEAAVMAGRLGVPGGIAKIAAACADAPPAGGTPRTQDMLLDGLVARYLEGHAAAAPLLRRAIDEFPAQASPRWLNLVLRCALDLWDADAAYRLADAHVRLARSTGALLVLPLALSYLAIVHGTRGGRFHYGDELADEAASISWAIGLEPRPYAAMTLAANRGDAARWRAVTDAALPGALARDEGSLITYVNVTETILHNGYGRYAAAADAAEPAAKADDLGMGLVLAELVEAAARSDRPEVAQWALDRLADQTGGGTTPFGSAMLIRAQATLMDGEAADDLFAQALALLEKAPAQLHVARTHLLWGESLRREGKRSDAREHLRTALRMYTAIGISSFADRAAGELDATGEHVRSRAPEARGRLTPQESRVARLARGGLSNPEIAAQLFLSRRTVEYHLHNAYVKLGIRSRGELAAALPDADEAMEPATTLAGSAP